MRIQGRTKIARRAGSPGRSGRQTGRGRSTTPPVVGRVGERGDPEIDPKVRATLRAATPLQAPLQSAPALALEQEPPDEAAGRSVEVPTSRAGSAQPGGVASAGKMAKVAAPEAEAVAEPEPVEELDYAFVFTGDEYGRTATAFIKTYNPGHRLIRARSFEAMFARLAIDLAEPSRSRPRRVRRRVRELIIVTHANAAGGLKIPLAAVDVSKRRFFSPSDLADLQAEFQDGAHRRFRAQRNAVVRESFDAQTRVVVRGCEFGQHDEALRVLRTFFGGEASVHAPRGYQGYEGGLPIGGDLLPTPEAAYDFIVAQAFLPVDMRPGPDETKRAYVKRVFPGGSIPGEFFLFGAEARARFGDLKGEARGSRAAETLKDREGVETPGDDGRVWNGSFDMDETPLRHIAVEAAAIGRDYRPQQACRLLRLKAAWERRMLVDPLFRAFFASLPASAGPLAGSAEDTAPFMAYLIERFRDDPGRNPLAGVPIQRLFPLPGPLEADARRHPCAGDDAFERESLDVVEPMPDAALAARTFIDPPTVAVDTARSRSPRRRHAAGRAMQRREAAFLQALGALTEPDMWRRFSEGGVGGVVFTGLHPARRLGPAERAVFDAVRRTAELLGEDGDFVGYWTARQVAILGAVRRASMITNTWDVHDFLSARAAEITELAVDRRFEHAGEALDARGGPAVGDALYAEELATLVRVLLDVREAHVAAQEASGKALGKVGKDTVKAASSTMRAVGDVPEIKDGSEPPARPAAAGKAKPPKLNAAYRKAAADRATADGAPGAARLSADAEIQRRREALGRNLQSVDRMLGLLQAPGSIGDRLAKIRKTEGLEWVVSVADLIKAGMEPVRNGVWLLADLGARLESLSPSGPRFWTKLRDAKLLSLAGRVFAVVDVVAKVKGAWVAIRDDKSAREQAAALHGAAQSLIVLGAEFGGATAQALAAPATGVAFVVWAQVDVLFTVAEIVREGRNWKALEAARGFAAEAQRLAHLGNPLLKAAIVIEAALGETDPVGVAAIDRALQVIEAHKPQFRLQAGELSRLLHSRNPAAIGAYPAALAFGPEARRLLSQWSTYGAVNALELEREAALVGDALTALAKVATARYAASLD